jgi:hypothetical protein
MNEKRVSEWAQATVITIVALLLLSGVANAFGQTTGGGFETREKADFTGGNTTDSRVSGGQQLAGLNYTPSLYCWRLGVFGNAGCFVAPHAYNFTCVKGMVEKLEDFVFSGEEVVKLKSLKIRSGVASVVAASSVDDLLVLGLVLLFSVYLVVRFRNRALPFND